MKKLFTFVLLMVISYAFGFSQNDARTIPYYLNIEKEQHKMVFGKHRAYIRGDRPSNNIKYEISEKILAGSAFKLIPISGNSGTEDETWITINPMNPNNIVGSSNNTQYNYSGAGYRMAAYYTLDGGNNWAVSTTPPNAGVYISAPTNGSMTNFDPGLAFDTKGNLFYTYGFAQVGNSSTSDEYDNGVFVNRSTDGGKTWQDPIPIVYETQGTSSQPFHDRYSIASDMNLTSPYKDRLYVSWQRFKVSPGVIVSFSSNQGQDWSSPSFMSGSGNNSQAPMPTVGPTGVVYVAWRVDVSGEGSTQLLLNRSSDGGKSWLGTPIPIMKVKNLGTLNSLSGRNVLPDKQNIRISSCPYIIADLSNGPRKGWLYCVTAGKDNSAKTHCFLARSTDNGSTWSTPQVIDGNTIGTDVIFPSVAVDPVTGTVSVFYYSSENDPTNKGLDAYLAASFDGVNFSQYRLSPATWYLSSSNNVSYQGPGNYYWGDYSSITAYGGKIYPCFWMPLSGNDYNSVAAFTADISTSPMPPSNVTYINTFLEPSKVILNWVDPTLNNLGGPLTDYKIEVYKDNTFLAEVNKGVQTYTDNSAVSGKTFIYNLKTKSSDGLESPFVTITGVSGGSSEAMPPTDISAKPTNTGFVLSWKTPSKHIDSSEIQDLDRVEIYSGTNLLKSVSVPTITAGNTSSTDIVITTEKFYRLNMVAVTKRGTMETKSRTSDTIFAYAGAPLTDFSENFDNSAKLTPYITGGLTTWGISTQKSVSAPNCFTDAPDGIYKANSMNYVIFAPVIIKQEKHTLSFEHIAMIRTNNHAAISISKDLKLWKDIMWYDKNRSSGWTNDLATSTWLAEHRTLSEFIGDTVYIKLYVYSGIFKNPGGWYVDDLVIDDNVNSVEDFAKISDNIQLAAYPNPSVENVNLTVNLSNPMILQGSIYDVLGNKVMEIFDKMFDAGKFDFNINLANILNGVYHFRVNSNGVIKTQSFVVNK